MIITKAGRRTVSGTKLRIIETAIFDPSKTSVVARPKPMALTTVPVTANNGHKPNS